MPAHFHIASKLFGPSNIVHPSGAVPPQGQSAPYQELLLLPNGDVLFKRNLPQVDGTINAAPWPGLSPVVGLEKY
jgi:hypothetical protein